MRRDLTHAWFCVINNSRRNKELKLLEGRATKRRNSSPYGMVRSQAGSAFANGDVCFAPDTSRANGHFRGIMMVRK